MHRINYNEDHLPFSDLEKIGLAANGQLLLNIDDLKALLSGRRTGMLHLHDLQDENIRIKSMDAKISLMPNKDGKMDLLIHPIYRKAQTPDYLDAGEAESLQKGDVASLLKITIDNHGNKKELLVEYDPETREFIVSDSEKILVPDMVNNEFLTEAQKKKYRKGEEVELADGTTFNYSATDIHGIRANKIALVASVLIDGGLSYMLYKGLNAIFNKKRDPVKAETLSRGYYSAVSDIEDQRPDSRNKQDQTGNRTIQRRR